MMYLKKFLMRQRRHKHMKQDFSGLFKNGTGKSAGDELRKVQTDKNFNLKIIPIDKIRPNPKNDYPIEDIKQLAESVKKTLIHPLNVVTIQGDSSYDYELLSGERRYTAIKYLLEQGDDTYKIGIPCKVKNGDVLDAIDQEILLIEANELEREKDAARRRKKIERLQELYRMKMQNSSPEDSEKQDLSIKEQEKLVTKAAAEKLGISERQIRKYNTVNEKLIPELQQIFDASGIPLNDAAVYANMDEAAQQTILQIMKQNDSLSKDKILRLQKELEEKEAARLQEQERLESSLQKAAAENEQLKQQMSDKESELEMREAEYEQEKQLLEEKIWNEAKNAAPDTEMLNSLHAEIQKLEAVKSEQESQNQLASFNQQKFEDEYELNQLYESIQSNIRTYKKKVKEYEKKHGTLPSPHNNAGKLPDIG